MNRSLFIAMVLTATILSCKRRTEDSPSASKAAAVDSAFVDSGPPVPSGDLHGRVFHFAIGVYFTPGTSKVDTDEVVRGMVHGKPIAFSVDFA
jgi:hypothetical protein